MSVDILLELAVIIRNIWLNTKTRQLGSDLEVYIQEH